MVVNKSKCRYGPFNLYEPFLVYGFLAFVGKLAYSLNMLICIQKTLLPFSKRGVSLVSCWFRWAKTDRREENWVEMSRELTMLLWKDGRRKIVPVSRCHRDKWIGECVSSVSIKFKRVEVCWILENRIFRTNEAFGEIIDFISSERNPWWYL